MLYIPTDEGRYAIAMMEESVESFPLNFNGYGEENVLVAAGAGSGKTRTLAEKVFTIIDKGEVKPSELLVLTFTDNAAHEMRERIIQTFKDRGKDDIAEQVASAHIRTFDSFARYLVSSYADVICSLTKWVEYKLSS